jgi:hypothetical protein
MTIDTSVAWGSVAAASPWHIRWDSLYCEQLQHIHSITDPQLADDYQRHPTR